MGARWGRELDHAANQAWTALGVWPLLAMLAAGAAGPARTELEQALGVPANQAPAQARELLELIRRVPGCAAALGVWTAADAGVEPAWAALLGPSAHRELTGDRDKDRAALDGWAREQTEGLLPGLPLDLDQDTQLVLASALLVRTRWPVPFRPGFAEVAAGPWAGRPVDGLEHSGPELFRRISVARGAAGPVTEVRITGGGGIDVHLVLGEPAATPGAVVAAGFDLVAGALPRIPLTDLPDGTPAPGLRLAPRTDGRQQDLGTLRTVAFTVRALHDLCERAELFGLTAAGAEDEGWFPGISRRMPLYVAEARQSTLAAFSAAGFEAGAVTALRARLGAGVPPHRERPRAATASFDRPFAFLAVHRPTGLVLMAGWVAEPGTAS
nr:serpin family protein [Kitasatospora sp. SID7827]